MMKFLKNMLNSGLVAVATSFFLVCANTTKINNVDLIVFSFDRPMQLYALLESAERYLKNCGVVSVIYRSSNMAYKHGYELVQNKFQSVVFIQQGNNPYADFKPLTSRAILESPSEYIMFAVDDIIVKDHVDLARCVQLLEDANAYGFYLRLGKNLSECYPNRCGQPVPPLKYVDADIYSWQLGQGRYCWGYPNTVDMTIYRKRDIQRDFESMYYRSPNTLEAEWAGRAGIVMGHRGLCFETSKIVNIPLNRVQHEFNNRAMNAWSPQELVECFLAGKKIDVNVFSAIDNHAAHMEYALSFVSL